MSNIDRWPVRLSVIVASSHGRLPLSSSASLPLLKSQGYGSDTLFKWTESSMP